MAIKNEQGNWIHDKEEIKTEVVGYFSKLFTDDGIDQPYQIPYGVCTQLSQEHLNLLTQPYTRSEIDCVIINMGSHKAPGPDGFQALFYQKNWDLVADNVYSTVLATLEEKGLPKTLNETFSYSNS